MNTLFQVSANDIISFRYSKNVNNRTYEKSNLSKLQSSTFTCLKYLAYEEWTPLAEYIYYRGRIGESNSFNSEKKSLLFNDNVLCQCSAVCTTSNIGFIIKYLL